MKLPKISKPTFYLITIGLSIRLVFAFFTKDPWDMNAWMSIGSAIYSGLNPYTLTSNALVYPPMWGLFCTLSHFAYTVTANPFVFYFTIKLPIIIADITIALLLKKIVQDLTNNPKKAQFALIIYLFNPVTIVFSGLWGMFDAIPALFTFLSVYYLSRTDYLKSGITLGIGISFKGFFPALLLPFFIFYLFKKDNKLMMCLRYLLYTIFIPMLISIPFVINTLSSYTGSLIYHLDKIPQNLTYWFSIRLFSDVIEVPANTINALGSYFFITAFLLMYILILKSFGNIFSRKKNINNTQILLRTSLQILFAFLVTSSTVSEQYLIWTLPLLATYLTVYNLSLKPYYFLLSSLNILFISLNVGLNFFNPLIEMPQWWINFQYSWPALLLMAIIGVAFSITCAILLIKLKKLH